MKVIDEAFADPEAHEKKCGVPPSVLDFELAGHVALCAFTLLESGFPLEDLRRPSMTYFYGNLAHVVHDGFWMYPRFKTKLTPQKVYQAA